MPDGGCVAVAVVAAASVLVVGGAFAAEIQLALRKPQLHQPPMIEKRWWVRRSAGSSAGRIMIQLVSRLGEDRFGR
ncbi:hypothetical protein [Nocardia sp. NPDC004860]|uniref:hypothetical protein n=1 Tax=Nocardia sp. NPDC004860 TaxID=3154557 RepID=UPI0033A071BA